MELEAQDGAGREILYSITSGLLCFMRVLTVSISGDKTGVDPQLRMAKVNRRGFPSHFSSRDA